MQETIYRNIEEYNSPQGAYDIIRALDHNVRDISNELYVFRREAHNKFDALEADLSSLKKDVAELQQNTAVLKNDVSELKQEVKDLRRDVSDIKGDIKALAAGFGAAQNRFNWGLVILGIIVALIQLLK